MHATNATNARTESIQQHFAIPGRPDLEGFLSNVSRFDDVEAIPRPRAHVCGAVGCRLTHHLSQVRIDGFGKRVLCPIHILDLVDREVGLT